MLSKMLKTMYLRILVILGVLHVLPLLGHLGAPWARRGNHWRWQLRDHSWEERLRQGWRLDPGGLRWGSTFFAGVSPWNCSLQDPEGVKELAKEFARAGADVTQTFTFYSTDDWVSQYWNLVMTLTPVIPGGHFWGGRGAKVDLQADQKNEKYFFSFLGWLASRSTPPLARSPKRWPTSTGP